MLNGNRRIIIYVIAGLLLIYGCEHFLTLKEISAQRYVLHTITEIKVLCRNERQGHRAINAAFARLKELENKFNYFNPGSELSLINQQAYAQETAVSPEMYQILELALEGSRISGGAFDITVTPITRMYGFGTGKQQVPSEKKIRTELQAVGWQNIQLNPDRQSVRLLHKNTRLDLGGIAKGYAVDEAALVLREYGLKNGLVNAGGNIYALGKNRGQNWRIGIRHPRGATDNIQIIELSENACATSGDYEQYFLDAKQQRYSHIFNPKTGRPANLDNGLASVTVIADTAGRADMLSTACFVLGEEKSAEIPGQKFFYKAE